MSLARTPDIHDNEPLPRCSVDGCPNHVWNSGFKKDEHGLFVAGTCRPLSDKCWWHEHGKEPPMRNPCP